VKFVRCVVAIAVIVGSAAPALARPPASHSPQVPPDPNRPWLIPPVDGPIVKHWEAPESNYGPGHRGIDYFVTINTSVRAAAGGRVTFAGPVAQVKAVTIEHTGGMETTYSNLNEVSVSEGTFVTQGQWIGLSGWPHVADPSLNYGLHFGVKINDQYVNPESFFGPVDVAGAIYLTPLMGERPSDLPYYPPALYEDEPCRPANEVSKPTTPPNDNIAIIIPGITSSTVRGFNSDVFGLAASLGYPSEHVYIFSYKGSFDSDFHEPYESVDTYGSFREATGRLATMLLRIADRHPGADIDLLAHSQGGLIARGALELAMTSWQPGMPRIDHLVTYATPHQGVKLADLPSELERDSFTGGVWTDLVSRLAEQGVAIPNPDSAAVEDLRPDSDYLDQLADHDVVFGTRVLSLSAVNDWFVPSSRSQSDLAVNDAVPASGVSGHGGILWSREARNVAYSFLRDGVTACPTLLDDAGPVATRAIDFVQDHAATAYSAVEGWMLGFLGRRQK
jgi:hypothetical protein